MSLLQDAMRDPSSLSAWLNEHKATHVQHQSLDNGRHRWDFLWRLKRVVCQPRLEFIVNHELLTCKHIDYEELGPWDGKRGSWSFSAGIVLEPGGKLTIV